MIDDETADKLSIDPHMLVAHTYQQGRSVEAVRSLIRLNATLMDRALMNRSMQRISRTLARHLADWAGLEGAWEDLLRNHPTWAPAYAPEVLALRELGASVRSVENALRSLGIVGERREASHCAISNYLRRTTGAIMVTTTDYNIMVDGRHFEPTEAVGDFIVKFDDGNTYGIESPYARDALSLRIRD